VSTAFTGPGAIAPSKRPHAVLSVCFSRGQPEVPEEAHDYRADARDRVSGPSGRSQRSRVDGGRLLFLHVDGRRRYIYRVTVGRPLG